MILFHLCRNCVEVFADFVFRGRSEYRYTGGVSAPLPLAVLDEGNVSGGEVQKFRIIDVLGLTAEHMPLPLRNGGQPDSRGYLRIDGRRRAGWEV